MKIGIAGTGRMGTAVATRLLQEGHTIYAWNRTGKKLAPLEKLGATLSDSPAQLASSTETIITLLTDSDAINSVYDTEQGILAGSLKGKLIIDMSTVQPATAQALAARVTAQGAAFVECPVGGTVAPALAGKLIGLAGGSDSDVERARPLLDQLCRRLEHVGPAGSGASVKLAINLPLIVYWQTLGEALTLCKDLGLDSARLVDLISDTSGGPAVMKNRAGVVAKALDGENVPGTFDIDLMRKDLRTMLAEGERLGASLPVTSITLDSYNESVKTGLANADGSVHTAWLRDQTNRLPG